MLIFVFVYIDMFFLWISAFLSRKNHSVLLIGKLLKAADRYFQIYKYTWKQHKFVLLDKINLQENLNVFIYV